MCMLSYTDNARALQRENVPNARYGYVISVHSSSPSHAHIHRHIPSARERVCVLVKLGEYDAHTYMITYKYAFVVFLNLFCVMLLERYKVAIFVQNYTKY